MASSNSSERAGIQSTDPAASSPNEASESALLSEKSSTLSLNILPYIRESQNQHGLRHGDYLRYHGYCSRRIRRIRHSLGLMQGKNRYTKKDVPLAAINDPRHLLIILTQAERAWTHGMALKGLADSQPRKFIHAIRKFRKAAKHAARLEEACRIDKLVDARTTLEAQAYNAWMSGNESFETQHWEPALSQYSLASMIYAKLSTVCTSDQRSLYNQRVDDILPGIRFCAFNLTGTDVNLKELDELRKKMAESAGLGQISEKLKDVLSTTLEQQKEASHEITWRGRVVSVKNEKLRGLIAKAQETVFEIERDASDGLAADSKKSIEESSDQLSSPAEQMDRQQQKRQKYQDSRLAKYDELFVQYNDIISMIRDDIKSDQASSKVKSLKTEAQIDELKFLLNYTIALKLTRTIERDLIMIENLKSKLSGDAVLVGIESLENLGQKQVKPDDIVRIYSLILQNLSELSEIPGTSDNAESSKELAAKTLFFKAYRCYYAAESYLYNKQFGEAMALFDRSKAHAVSATTQCELCTQSSEMQGYLNQLRSLSIMLKGRKIATQAVFAQESNKSIVGEDLEAYASKPLIQRLDVLVDSPAGTGSKKPTLVAFPPDFEVVACKPLFFDLALNYVELPSVAHRIGTEKSQQAEKQQASSSPAANSEGSAITGVFNKFFGWGGKK